MKLKQILENISSRTGFHTVKLTGQEMKKGKRIMIKFLGKHSEPNSLGEYPEIPTWFPKELLDKEELNEHNRLVRIKT